MADLKISYEKGWNSACIHADLPWSYEEDYQMCMLKNNSIPHLAHISGVGRDGTSRYTFRSDGGILLEEKFRSRDIHARDVLTFTEQLLETADSLAEHMLNPDRILLSPELVFAEEDNFQFCYLPAEREDASASLGESFHRMTEYFVGKLDYRETDGILLVYRLHKETMQENYDLKKILDEYKKDLHERREEQKKIEDETDEIKQQISHKIEEESRGISEEFIFFADEEGENLNNAENKYSEGKKDYCIREKTLSYGPVRKVINRIKTGRWGEWEDLITEMDGQDR